MGWWIEGVLGVLTLVVVTGACSMAVAVVVRTVEKFDRERGE